MSSGLLPAHLQGDELMIELSNNLPPTETKGIALSLRRNDCCKWMLRAIKLAVSGILLVGAAETISPGLGQGLLTKPVRLIVGFTAGGPTDVPARFIAEKLSIGLGKPVIVENKPGAGGVLAMNEVLSQPRNGQSLLACTYVDPLNPLLYKNVTYKVSDIAPVSLFAKYYYMIAVSPTVQAKNFGELVQYAREHPDELNYGHL